MGRGSLSAGSSSGYSSPEVGRGHSVYRHTGEMWEREGWGVWGVLHNYRLSCVSLPVHRVVALSLTSRLPRKESCSQKRG